MNTTDDKFKRFLAMTDQPENFSNKDLMELARDPEMASWYAALSDVEKVIKTRSPLSHKRESLADARKLRAATPLHHGRGAQRTGWVISLLAIATMLTVAFILWPKPDAIESPSLATDEMSKLQKEEKEAPPVIAQQANQEHLLAINKKDKTVAHKGIDEPLQTKIADLTIVPTSADLGPSNKMRLGKHIDTLDHKDVDEPLQAKIAALTIVPTSADLGPGNKMRLGAPCPMTTGEETLPQENVSPIPPDKQALADIYLAEVALQVVYERQAQAEALRAYAASITDEEVTQPIIAF